jgi:CRP-like cAMP-binding protein
MAFSVFFALHPLITPEYQECIRSLGRIKYFKAGEFLKSPGETKTAVYFVVSGLLETYTIDSANRKKTIDFTWENQVCASTTATYFPNPLEEYIECCEDSTIIQFSMDAVIQIISKYQEGLAFYKKSLKQINKKSFTHIRLIQIEYKPERIIQFQNAFKKQLGRLTTAQQASYLCINRSTYFDARKISLRKDRK